MRRVLTATAVALSAAGLAACSSGAASQPHVVGTSATVAPPSSRSVARPAAAPSSSASTSSAPAAVPLGTVIDSRGAVKVAVLGYDPSPQAQYGLAPDPGTVYRGYDVRVCAEQDDVNASTSTWTLVTNAGTLLEETVLGPDDPQYKGATGMQTGECVTGWLDFDVPQGETPMYARYAPIGPDGQPVVINRWALS